MSPERERWAGLLAGALGAGLVLAAMAVAAVLVSAFGLVVHAATFFTGWVGVAAGVGVICARRSWARAGTYRLGADMEADAFAMSEVELVRRAGTDYDLGLVPGMSGAVEGGRSSLPLEALTGRGAVRVPVPPEGRVRVDFGTTTFIISRKTEVAAGAVPFRERLRWIGAGAFEKLARTAALGLPLAALPTLLGSVPAAHAVTELKSRWAIPPNATPAEAERLIRVKAQLQTPGLHQCFDPMPIACQRAGYVGVGLSLSREGEVLSHWISRSSYGQDCPVTECMSNVVAGWVFEPMRERMNVVIPIQVRRTNKPLVPDQRVLFVSPDVLDAGLGGGEVPALP